MFSLHAQPLSGPSLHYFASVVICDCLKVCLPIMVGCKAQLYDVTQWCISMIIPKGRDFSSLLDYFSFFFFYIYLSFSLYDTNLKYLCLRIFLPPQLNYKFLEIKTYSFFLSDYCSNQDSTGIYHKYWEISKILSMNQNISL